MAVRFDAVGDRLSIASPPSGDLTIMGWLYISADRGAYATMFAVGTVFNTSLRHFDLSGGETIHLYDGTTNDYGTVLSLSTWYHVCLTDSDVNDRQRGYLNGVLDVNTGQTAARSTTTMYAGNNSVSEWLNGRLAYIKVWNAELTADEILQEMYSIRPVRLDNLWMWTPLLPGAAEQVLDYSGNGRAWTAGGTLTDEDPPPISWGAAVHPLNIVSAPPAGGNPWYAYAQQ